MTGDTNSKPFKLIALLLTAILTMPSTLPVFADEAEGWPREIKIPDVTITMYQPQLEKFEKNQLYGLAAVSIQEKGKEEPVFGAVWMKANVDIDRDERMVYILDIKVERVRFPNATPEDEKRLAQILEQEIPKWGLDLTLDQMIAGLELAEKEQLAAGDLKNDPPKIILKNAPAVLITLDGDPILGDIENSKLKQVVNTPFLMVYDEKKKAYYLNGGKIWVTARDVMGPWKEEKKVPKEVAKMTPSDEEIGETGTDDRIPEVIVTKEAAELIVIDGTPEMAPIDGGELLYVKNTDSDIIMEIATQRYFALLSGRWYHSKSLQEGPWTFLQSDQLPESFAKIPPGSDMGLVLPSVAGTEQAEEALMDAHVPETSTVDRNDKSLKVEYDGKPKFEKAEDSEVQYAVNTASAVFKVKKMYYCCHEAVWYEAKDPNGPWSVCVKVPDEIYTIPPSCPHYNVKYVYVYDYTPQVVYVGYYPGYYGSYLYGGTVVYGTGWYYHPWHGRYYYPYHRTWGFHVRYNPWGGWSCGFSYTTGRFTFSIGFGGRRGWWGPGRYRGYPRAAHRSGYRRGYRAGYSSAKRNTARTANRNTYKRQENAKRNAQRTQTRKQPNVSTTKKNNVYADKKGNTYRQQSSGNWQKNSGGSKWSSTNVNKSSNVSRQSSARSRGGGRGGGGRGGGKRR